MAGVPPGCPLTARQFEILALLCDGLTYQQAALKLGVSRSTVRSHLHNVYTKLEVADARGAIAAMGRNGWWGWKAPEPPPAPEPAPTPFAVEHPFLVPYVAEFVRSRFPHEPDERSARGMAIALAGHRNWLLRG